MKLSPQDFQQTKQIANIIKYCDKADLKSLEQITDEIYRHQPFLLSLFLGYREDVNQYELDEILRILIIIWLFFRYQPNVKKTRISMKMFDNRQKKNVTFLRYLDGEKSQHSKNQLILDNLGALKSKALFTAVLFKVNEGAALKKLDKNISGIMILGMKSLIECFEQICKIK